MDEAAILSHFANRVDRHGFYGDDGKPKTNAKGSAPLTVERFARHLNATKADDVIGFHAISTSDTCKWVAFDVDQHDEDGPDRFDARVP